MIMGIHISILKVEGVYPFLSVPRSILFYKPSQHSNNYHFLDSRMGHLQDIRRTGGLEFPSPQQQGYNPSLDPHFHPSPLIGRVMRVQRSTWRDVKLKRIFPFSVYLSSNTQFSELYGLQVQAPGRKKEKKYDTHTQGTQVNLIFRGQRFWWWSISNCSPWPPSIESDASKGWPATLTVFGMVTMAGWNPFQIGSEVWEGILFIQTKSPGWNCIPGFGKISNSPFVVS